MFIYPYKDGSESVHNLKVALGAKVIRTEGSNFKGKPSKNVINWGSSSITNTEVMKCNVLNKPDAVKIASNKELLFNQLQPLNTINLPDFTTDIQVARGWLDEGETIVVREKLTGHSGEGIVLITDNTQWEAYNFNNAKLLVKYVPKKAEFRVHVFNGAVLYVQKKGFREGEKPYSFKIQNKANGFIFIQTGFETPECVIEQAVLAVQASGLDFGAVDIIYNDYRKKAYVLEINTAPGLEGNSVTNYSEAFSSFFQEG